MIYYAAIVAARARHEERITELEDDVVAGGVEWILARDWVDEGIKDWFRELLRIE